MNFSRSTWHNHMFELFMSVHRPGTMWWFLNCRNHSALNHIPSLPHPIRSCHKNTPFSQFIFPYLSCLSGAFALPLYHRNSFSCICYCGAASVTCYYSFLVMLIHCRRHFKQKSKQRHFDIVKITASGDVLYSSGPLCCLMRSSSSHRWPNRYFHCSYNGVMAEQCAAT